MCIRDSANLARRKAQARDRAQDEGRTDDTPARAQALNTDARSTGASED